MKILLVGNYPLDAQESMRRFSEMLLGGLRERGYDVQFIQPCACLGAIPKLPRNLIKWLGYVDKYIVFPIILWRRKSAFNIVHICDHSNAVYSFVLGDMPHLVTCHDVLAIRAALGEETHCKTSWTGKYLQRWILLGLRHCSYIVCDSDATLHDLKRLFQDGLSPSLSVILIAQNYDYRQLTNPIVMQKLEGLSLPDVYLLHVGSNLPRKNRDGILRIFSLIQDRWEGGLVFAGQELSSDLRALAHHLGVAERVVEIARPSNDVLESLYNQAFALIFPSFSEGFGWPVIEAQACGCPVLCSDRCSLPEVAGDGAIILPVEEESAFAEAILSLSDPEHRQDLITRGLTNSKRFKLSMMLDAYIEIYATLCPSLSF